MRSYYTIPRNKWELQPSAVRQLFNYIIPYQEINGNYNSEKKPIPLRFIIPYQEINGNYNAAAWIPTGSRIIPYQEINGNYNGILRIMGLR